MTSGPVLDFDPGAIEHAPAGEPVDTRDPPFPYAHVAVAIVAALALTWTVWRMRHFVGRTAATFARSAAPYWREIGLFTLLAAILLRLW